MGQGCAPVGPGGRRAPRSLSTRGPPGWAQGPVATWGPQQTHRGGQEVGQMATLQGSTAKPLWLLTSPPYKQLGAAPQGPQSPSAGGQPPTWGVRAGQWGRAEPPGPYIFIRALYQKSLENPPHKYHQHTQTLSTGPEKHPQRDTLTPHPHPSAPHGFLGLTAKQSGVSRRWLPAGDPAHRLSPGSGPRRAEGTPARLWGTTPRSQSPRGEPGGRMHRFPRCCHPVKGHPLGFGFGFGASTGTPRQPWRGGSRHRPPRASRGCCGVPGGSGGPTPSPHPAACSTGWAGLCRGCLGAPTLGELSRDGHHVLPAREPVRCWGRAGYGDGGGNGNG